MKDMDDEWLNNEVIMKAVVFLVVLSAALGACSMLNRQIGLPDDHPLEEAIEEELKVNLDLDVDLTPESPE